MAVAAAKMGTMQPLPLAPSGSFHVAGGVDFLEDADGNGSVFLWGMAAWCWRAGDVAARRLAAVQLVNSKAAKQRQVADAFGVHENSLVRWRGAYEDGGVESLVTDRPGPRGPSKVTDAKRAEIRCPSGLGPVVGRGGTTDGGVDGHGPPGHGGRRRHGGRRWDRRSGTGDDDSAGPAAGGARPAGPSGRPHGGAGCGTVRPDRRCPAGDLRRCLAPAGRGTPDPSRPGRHRTARDRGNGL